MNNHLIFILWRKLFSLFTKKLHQIIMFASLFEENEDGEDNSQDASVFTSPSSHLNSPAPGRNASGFVGLENQGATCYMNSLLQAWFMTPEIRGALYSLSPETELNVANIKATDVEARKLKSKAPRKVPLHLQKLFTELQYSQRRSVTTSELTKEGFGFLYQKKMFYI